MKHHLVSGRTDGQLAQLGVRHEATPAFVGFVACWGRRLKWFSTGSEHRGCSGPSLFHAVERRGKRRRMVFMPPKI